MMKRYSRTIITAAVAMVMLYACGNRTTVALSGEELYRPRFAERFSIYSTGGTSAVIEIKDPWQGAEGAVSQVFVSRNGETPPAGFVGSVVEAPVTRVVCLSSTHVAFLDALDATNIIYGVSGADYISNPNIRERYTAGKVRDVGYDAAMNYELLAGMRPDLVFIYGVGGENNAVTDKLRELHIPFIYIGDYMETTPLGKAEWIVPFGELTDRRQEAEEIFADISERYDSLKNIAAEFTVRPKVMLNAPYRDVWFVPGGNSYMATLIRDAGGEYIFCGGDDSASRPISAEAAYVAARDADVWLTPNQALSIEELKSQNPKFKEIKCVEQQRVYNCTRQRTPEGGSDFWESGALHADRVLQDLVLCLHSEEETNADSSMYYFERLE